MKKRILLKTICLLLTAYYNCISQPAGNSLLLDGVNNYAVVADNSMLDFSDSLSIEFWINPGGNIYNEVIISKQWCNGDDYAYSLQLDSGKVSFDWSPDGDCTIPNYYCTDSAVVSNYSCSHVAVVFNTSQVKIFINGIERPGSLAGGNYSTIHKSSSQLRIGSYRRYDGTITNHFHGEIDELRFWNYQLSSNEINSRMNLALTGNEPGLVAYYDMEETGSGNGLSLINKCTATGSGLNATTIGNSYYPKHIAQCTYTGIVPPINLTTTNITSSNAKCNWTAVSGAAKYKVRYRKVGTTTWTMINAIAISKKLTGLDSITQYEWNVKSYVSSTWSSWSIKKKFTTLATPGNHPEKFESDFNTEINVDIFPNPNNGHFIVDFGEFFDGQSHSIIIHNVLSQTIFETKTNEQKVKINLNDLAEKGIYFLEIKDEKNQIITSRKIIIQ